MNDLSIKKQQELMDHTVGFIQTRNLQASLKEKVCAWIAGRVESCWFSFVRITGFPRAAASKLQMRQQFEQLSFAIIQSPRAQVENIQKTVLQTFAQRARQVDSTLQDKQIAGLFVQTMQTLSQARTRPTASLNPTQIAALTQDSYQLLGVKAEEKPDTTRSTSSDLGSAQSTTYSSLTRRALVVAGIAALSLVVYGASSYFGALGDFGFQGNGTIPNIARNATVEMSPVPKIFSATICPVEPLHLNITGNPTVGVPLVPVITGNPIVRTSPFEISLVPHPAKHALFKTFFVSNLTDFFQIFTNNPHFRVSLLPNHAGYSGANTSLKTTDAGTIKYSYHIASDISSYIARCSLFNGGVLCGVFNRGSLGSLTPDSVTDLTLNIERNGQEPHLPTSDVHHPFELVGSSSEKKLIKSLQTHAQISMTEKTPQLRNPVRNPVLPGSRKKKIPWPISPYPIVDRLSSDINSATSPSLLRSGAPRNSSSWTVVERGDSSALYHCNDHFCQLVSDQQARNEFNSSMPSLRETNNVRLKSRVQGSPWPISLYPIADRFFPRANNATSPSLLRSENPRNSSS